MNGNLRKFANLVLTVYWGPTSAIRNVKLFLWFVLVTSCFNSGKIQWSPFKILRVGESLLNGQDSDFSRFFRKYSFETSWKVPSNIHSFKFNNGDTRIMHQICSKLTSKKLGWRYWPLSVVFIVVALNIFHTLFCCFHCWVWKSKCLMMGLFLIFVSSYSLPYN